MYAYQYRGCTPIRKGCTRIICPNKVKRARQAKAELAEEHSKNQANTEDLIKDLPRHVYCMLLILWSSFSVFIYLSVLASAQGVDLQSMVSLQWDVALEQWASKVSPKLASPQLSMAFFMFQDAAFVCSLAW